MLCPNCHRETEPSLFCHLCDAYMPNPAVGARAGVARRFAAQLLDAVAVWAIVLVVVIIAVIVGGATQSAGLILGALFGSFIGYIVFALWFLAQGRTPGKWLAGIRVVDKQNGSLPGLGRMLVRETIGKFASGLIFGLGYFWAIFDKDTQAWHDKIAGTAVVRQAVPAIAAPPAVYAVQAAAVGAVSPPPPAGTRFCTHCGAALNAAHQFCQSCGARA